MPGGRLAMSIPCNLRPPGSSSRPPSVGKLVTSGRWWDQRGAVILTPRRPYDSETPLIAG